MPNYNIILWSYLVVILIICENDWSGVIISWIIIYVTGLTIVPGLYENDIIINITKIVDNNFYHNFTYNTGNFYHIFNIERWEDQ